MNHPPPSVGVEGHIHHRGENVERAAIGPTARPPDRPDGPFKIQP